MKGKRPAKRQLATVATSPPERPIAIVGTLAGNVIAEDRTDHPGKASQIAASWRESGLSVTVA